MSNQQQNPKGKKSQSQPQLPIQTLTESPQTIKKSQLVIKPSLVKMPPKPNKKSDLITLADKFYTDIRQNDPTGVFMQFEQPIEDFKNMVGQSAIVSPR